TVNLTNALRNGEVSAKDKLNPTPMAIPDIYVSRINPASVSWADDPNFRDAIGQSIYDQDGNPRILEGPNDPGGSFSPDLERTLLVQYFDNNHIFRLGNSAQTPFRSGAATNPQTDFSVEDFSKLVSQARNDWTALPTNTVHNPGLADYA